MLQLEGPVLCYEDPEKPPPKQQGRRKAERREGWRWAEGAGRRRNQHGGTEWINGRVAWGAERSLGDVGWIRERAGRPFGE